MIVETKLSWGTNPFAQLLWLRFPVDSRGVNNKWVFLILGEKLSVFYWTREKHYPLSKSRECI